MLYNSTPSDPIPTHLRATLTTGSGLPRRLPRPQTLSEEWACKPSYPGPSLSADGVLSPTTAQNVRGTSRILIANRAGYRSYDYPYHCPIDEFGEPITSIVPGSEIDIAAYRRAEREAERLRGYVPGWSAKGMTEKYFGPASSRFRPFTTEPYFPDRCGFLLFHHAFP